MDDDDGMEKFSVNDADLDFAMNPGKYRRRQTKEQAALGIWAGGSSDEDEVARPAFGKKRPNYNAPVNFVSGGIKVGNKIEREDGAGPPTNNMGPKMEEDSPIELNFNKKQKSAPPPQKKQKGANVFAGMRSSTVNSTVDSAQMDDWLTKSGKGNVLQNMMKKMGWEEGKGLGKQKQGITEPVQAALRPERGAVGAYGKEVSSAGPRFGESPADAQKRIASTWKKTTKVKTVYRTVDDVINDGGSIRALKGTSVSKVIDMTGPEQRVYSGYDAFSLKTKAEAEDEPRGRFDVPELTHNINLLLDLTEEDIRRTNHQLGVLKDSTVALEHDYDRAKEEMDRAQGDYDRMKSVFNLLDDFSSKPKPSMVECEKLFQRPRSEFPMEYRLYQLDAAAVPLVLPLIQAFFARWRPLEPDQTTQGIEMMKRWRETLATSDTKMFPAQAVAMDKLAAFDRLMWDRWMPAIRRAVLQWEPRTQHHQLIDVVEHWLPIMPNWMKENLLDRIIVPKIEQTAQQWNPLTDPVPIHSWLIPWLDIMGDRLVPVFAPIRQALAHALKMWTPLDPGALVMLTPWKGVWAQGTMSAFCNMNIVPALEKMFVTMNLNPVDNPTCPEFGAVLQWRKLINDDILVNIINRYFFPRWFDQVCAWLDSAPGDRAVVNDVLTWYNEWKGRFPQDLVDKFPTITENLKRAMVAIHASSQGRRVGGAPAQPIHQTPPPPPPPMPVRPPPMPAMPTVQLTLREILEREAGAYDITFTPQPGRQKDGHQVFWFGTLSIYISAGVVYMYDPANFEWYPTTIQRLLQYNNAVA
ncbi:unnamed protein product, partial [Mesorhabditis spiculigera]